MVLWVDEQMGVADGVVRVLQQKKPRHPAGPCEFLGDLTLPKSDDFGSLKTLRAFHNGEFHQLTLVQCPVARAHDRRIVNKDIRLSFASNKSIPLARIEPLHTSSNTFTHCNFSF